MTPVTENDEPLPPDLLAGRLSEVFAVLGPLYRRTTRALELKERKEGFPVGVRAVLELLRMGGQPMTVPQMGRTLALSRQFVQRMVNEAAGRDLVEAVPNPAHQRSSLIRLTDTGRSTIDALVARERVLLRQAGDDLTAADIDACVRVLTRLLALFEDVDVN
ncbi:MULTISPECIES: MarR family winged helix-turn-helix transcriptional regulator [Streptomyces]|uniref:DNA-binding MarR family transcriptional regulator n=1 Tax=Streptomyces stelliscabiei TaxID=146820 RepID=A0A8I0TRG9_9ACTN|nr:DNA-binding MarR family transcriptional regulator [Streptomyces stelliscabiei]SOD77069.1 DNA-binding transcriptional regulator, MarR family [Streptomyces sp. 1222.2]